MMAKRNQNVSNYTRVFKKQNKTFNCLKKMENGPEQKRLNLNFLVLIENVLFRSRILFQKRIYSIFFGTKAGKRKLSILKERGFDIANFFPSVFGHQNPGSGMDPDLMNSDPQLWGRYWKKYKKNVVIMRLNR